MQHLEARNGAEFGPWLTEALNNIRKTFCGPLYNTSKGTLTAYALSKTRF